MLVALPLKQCSTIMDFLRLLTILSFVSLIVAENNTAKCAVGNCALLTQLECALYTTDQNERKLNQAFFPPRKSTTRYIRVNYDFKTDLDPNDDLYNSYLNVTQNCRVSYIWAVGGFLLIQPPSIFEWTSLIYSYPANDIYELDLTLNISCTTLVNVKEDGTCRCKGKDDNNLDILTQQVSVILQTLK